MFALQIILYFFFSSNTTKIPNLIIHYLASALICSSKLSCCTTTPHPLCLQIKHQVRIHQHYFESNLLALIPEGLHHNFLPVGSTVLLVTRELVPPRFQTRCPARQPPATPTNRKPPPRLLSPDYFSIALEAWPLDRQACFPSISIRGSPCSGGWDWHDGTNSSLALNQSSHSATWSETHCGNSIIHSS